MGTWLRWYLRTLLLIWLGGGLALAAAAAVDPSLKDLLYAVGHTMVR